MWSDYATLEEVFTLKHNKKTNAARILDDMNITYRIMEYEVDENMARNAAEAFVAKLKELNFLA